MVTYPEVHGNVKSQSPVLSAPMNDLKICIISEDYIHRLAVRLVFICSRKKKELCSSFNTWWSRTVSAHKVLPKNRLQILDDSSRIVLFSISRDVWSLKLFSSQEDMRLLPKSSDPSRQCNAVSIRKWPLNALQWLFHSTYEALYLWCKWFLTFLEFQIPP